LMAPQIHRAATRAAVCQHVFPAYRILQGKRLSPRPQEQGELAALRRASEQLREESVKLRADIRKILADSKQVHARIQRLLNQRQK